MPANLANLILFVVMIGAFWALVIRPQQRRAAQHRAMVARIRAGDEIVTVGGIFGTVVEVGDRLVVSTLDGSRFELAPAAVGDIVRQASASGEPERAQRADAPLDGEDAER